VRRNEGLGDARDERLRESFASIAEIAGSGTGCPPAERLWDSARGRLSRRETEEVVLHLGECSACAAAWRLARELGVERDRGRVLASSVAWLRGSWVPIATAAALLVVAAGVVIQQRFTRERPAEYRATTYACAVSLVPQGEPLPRGRCVLRWSACPQGSTYDVRVTTENLEIVARARELDQPEFVVPEESLRSVPTAGRILWQVTAHLSDGGVTESPSYMAEVR
jgi:hypothetical protein